MKKTKFVVVLALVVVMALAMMAPAFASGGVSVEMKAINGGTQVQATVSLPAGTYMGSDLELLYDASKLTYKSFTPGAVPNVNVGNASGKITALFYDSAEKAYGDGTVFFTLIFDIASGASITADAISADYVDVYDGGYNTVISSGSVSFSCDHVWGDWTQTKAPTCKDAGEETRTCGACGKADTRAVDATGEHVYTSVVTAPTCTEEGYTTYTCGCGESYVGDKVAAKGHTFVETERKEATCKDAGYVKYACECGEPKTETLPATGAHNFVVEHERVNATCEDDGYVKYACGCGTVSEDVTVLPKLGHKFETYNETKAPTCTGKGAESATCSVCGETDTKEIAAKGHSFGEYTVTTAPTCTEKGEESATCSVCGETDTKDVKALGHKWGEWKVTVEATKTEDGEKVRVCEVCEKSETKEIPATGSVAPKTGDEANIALYAVMFVMAGAAVVALSSKKKEN